MKDAQSGRKTCSLFCLPMGKPSSPDIKYRFRFVYYSSILCLSVTLSLLYHIGESMIIVPNNRFEITLSWDDQVKSLFVQEFDPLLTDQQISASTTNHHLLNKYENDYD